MILVPMKIDKKTITVEPLFKNYKKIHSTESRKLCLFLNVIMQLR
jgi:hypothetical protein